MLHLLVDTSTWLDLCKRRDGQRWIVALRLLVHHEDVELLVPELVIEEFERNRERVESSMTTTVAQRFKLIKQDLDDYGGSGIEHAAEVIADLARDVPLIGAMTTRNFDEVLELVRAGRRLGPGLTPFDRSSRCVSRLDARCRGQEDWFDHDEHEKATFA